MRLFVILLIATLGVLAQGKKPERPPAKPPAVQLKDFQSNVTQEGRRTFVKGDDGKPMGGGLLWLNKPHVENFKADGTLDTIIDADEATVDQENTHDVWSDKNLLVRKADGNMSIKGVGFRFETKDSRLAISNSVQAVMRRRDLVGPGSTNRVDSNITVTSDQLIYGADGVVFSGHVHVVDPQGEVFCRVLKARFDEKNEVQELEAIDEVILTQGETKAEGKRAVFSRATGLLRLSEKTKWRMGDRVGESDLIILDRTNQTFRAENNVRMTLPSSLLGTNETDKAAAPKTNRVTIAAETFDYAPTNAVTRGPIAIFNGNVHAVDPQATLDAELLTIFFFSNKVVRAIADRAVRITRTGAHIQGERAVFENEEIAVTGHPTWQHENRSGKSDILVFNPRTQEIRAVNVFMELPHTGDTSFFGGTNKAVAKKASVVTTNILLVSAMYFTNKNNLASFAQNVRASESRGQIDADRVDVSYASSNRLQRIHARGDVILTEEKTQAIGQEADFNAETGMGRLTGSPKIFQDGREIIAREFTVDRNAGEFRPLPPFRAILRRSQSVDKSAATNRTSSFR